MVLHLLGAVMRFTCLGYSLSLMTSEVLRKGSTSRSEQTAFTFFSYLFKVRHCFCPALLYLKEKKITFQSDYFAKPAHQHKELWGCLSGPIEYVL